MGRFPLPSINLVLPPSSLPSFSPFYLAWLPLLSDDRCLLEREAFSKQALPSSSALEPPFIGIHCSKRDCDTAKPQGT